MLCSNVGIQIGHLVLTFSLFRLDRRHYALISISKACVRCHTSAECRAIQKNEAREGICLGTSACVLAAPLHTCLSANVPCLTLQSELQRRAVPDSECGAATAAHAPGPLHRVTTSRLVYPLTQVSKRRLRARPAGRLMFPLDLPSPRPIHATEEADGMPPGAPSFEGAVTPNPETQPAARWAAGPRPALS